MNVLSIFFSTYLLVFVGELGDKTQIAAGTSTLAYRHYARLLFFSSSLALTTVAGLTVFISVLIPSSILSNIQLVGGLLLVLYGLYLLFRQPAAVEVEQTEQEFRNHGLRLFWAHFAIVFLAELGDKTQIVTFASAVQNHTHLLTVFAGSACALITVTGLTVWGATKIATKWVPLIQKIGALGLIGFGVYMYTS